MCQDSLVDYSGTAVCFAYEEFQVKLKMATDYNSNSNASKHFQKAHSNYDSILTGIEKGQGGCHLEPEFGDGRVDAFGVASSRVCLNLSRGGSNRSDSSERFLLKCKHASYSMPYHNPNTDTFRSM